MRAILISVGDELLLGQTVDTNSAYLADALARAGVLSIEHVTVGDDQNALTKTLRRCAGQTDLLIVTGGLGPTADDITRQALADAMGDQLVEDVEALAHIEAFFRGRGRPMSPLNRTQALRPSRAQCLHNPVGTAPGIAAQLQSVHAFFLPGVPREMKVMFELHVKTQLPDPGEVGLFTAALHCFGMGESNLAQKLGELMARDRDPALAIIGTTVSAGICTVRLRAPGSAALEEAIEQVQQRLGPVIFGRDEQTLSQAVLDLLLQRQLTLATAESCTAGQIGKLLTDTPGSSAAYLGGWITYSNNMKHQQLGVPLELLQAHGAVSGPVVGAMASGAAARSGADCAIAVSGIAGPDGGTDDKPVGTIWIGLHLAGITPDTAAVRCHFPAALGREAIRDRAAKMALQLLRLRLLEKPLDVLDWLAPTATVNENASTTT